MVSLFSCSKSQGASFISLLDEIDIYIQVGNTTDALFYLEKSEKRASSVFDEIGIYKRYLRLGERAKAEKWIKKSIKKHSDREELKALYVSFLIDEERLFEAMNESVSLKETKYASLYSEAVLRYSKSAKISANDLFNPPKKKKKNVEASKEELARLYYDPRFIDIYRYCYSATNNENWIINAASIYMKNSEFAQACKLRPNKLKNVSDGYFWGTVFYDCGRYAESLEALIEKKDSWQSDAMSVKSIVLCSDDYYILGDDESSEEMRNIILSFDINDEDYDSEILQILLINSALYNRNIGDLFTEYEMLYRLVDEYPTYEPGLACYAEFALDTLRRPEEDVLYKVLRNAGLKTQAMEQNDRLPRVAIEDAFYRINGAIDLASLPELEVLREELYVQTQEGLSHGEKTGRLWRLLEKNGQGSTNYPKEIIRYALTNLILSGNSAEAEELFTSYLKNQYGLLLDEIAGMKMTELSLWEYQVAAWFLKERNVEMAKSIYETIIRVYSERVPGIVTQGQNDGVVSSLVNLSVIAGGYGDLRTSMENLNAASGKCTDRILKAEILYRMGKIYASLGDARSAVKTLKYAISLNSNHNKARLLLKTVSIK